MTASPTFSCRFFDSFELGAAFDDYFVRSAVDRAWQEAKGEMAEE